MFTSTPPTSFAASADDLADIEALSLQSKKTPASDESPSKKRARKGGERDDSHQDHEETPRGLHNRPILRPVSPKKGCRSLSPGQFTSPRDLLRLEKPVVIVPAEEGFESLPPDVQELVDAIESVHKDHTPFVPGEIQAELAIIHKRRRYRKPKDLWFTPGSSQADKNSRTNDSKQRALEELGVVLDIRHEAEMSVKFERHEAAWNSAVHHPLLALAFYEGREAFDDDEHGGDGTKAQTQHTREQDTQVRIENVTAATIAGDCVPHVRDASSPSTRTLPSAGEYAQTGKLVSSRVIEYEDHTSILAWSLSIPSSASSSEDSSDPDPFTESPRQADGTTHSKSGSKKVDFALVLDPKPGTSLHDAVQIILARLRQMPQQAQSINPSNYQPLLDAPIAVAVETKTIKAARDPLTQLGLIVAALHRRLHTLPVKHAVGSHALTDSGVLPTWPQIAVIDNTWRLYFACDCGGKIVRCPFALCMHICFQLTNFRT